MRKSIYTVEQIDALLSGKGMAFQGQAAIVDLINDPVEGGHYLIGTTKPYDVYTYINGVWVNSGPIQGPKGDKGDPFTYEDFTQEQLDDLERGAKAAEAAANASALEATYQARVLQHGQLGVGFSQFIILDAGKTYTSSNTDSEPYTVPTVANSLEIGRRYKLNLVSEYDSDVFEFVYTGEEVAFEGVTLWGSMSYTENTYELTAHNRGIRRVNLMLTPVNAGAFPSAEQSATSAEENAERAEAAQNAAETAASTATTAASTASTAASNAASSADSAKADADRAEAAQSAAETAAGTATTAANTATTAANTASTAANTASTAASNAASSATSAKADADRAEEAQEAATAAAAAAAGAESLYFVFGGDIGDFGTLKEYIAQNDYFSSYDFAVFRNGVSLDLNDTELFSNPELHEKIGTGKILVTASLCRSANGVFNYRDVIDLEFVDSSATIGYFRFYHYDRTTDKEITASFAPGTLASPTFQHPTDHVDRLKVLFGYEAGDLNSLDEGFAQRYSGDNGSLRFKETLNGKTIGSLEYTELKAFLAQARAGEAEINAVLCFYKDGKYYLTDQVELRLVETSAEAEKFVFQYYDRKNDVLVEIDYLPVMTAVLKYKEIPKFSDAIIDTATGKLATLPDAAAWPIRKLTVNDGTAVETVKVMGKNLFHRNYNTSLTDRGITVDWDAENQEFILNGTLTASGDLMLVTPLTLDWVPGNKYAVSVRHISGTAELAEGTGNNKYAWSIFQSGAAKYVRGSTINTEFLDVYSFTATAFELDAGKTLIFYFQCWRPGTVFENYRVKVQVEAGSAVTDWEPYRLKEFSFAGNAIFPERGVNNIATVPTADITVEYVADTKLYIDRKFSEIV